VGYDEAGNLARTLGGGHVHAHNERFDMLIRATGFDTDVDRTTHPLMMHLRESGLATGTCSVSAWKCPGTTKY
jgi:hypothetical protein